jgi:flagella basal body P-ring formation protein FlgA
MRVCRYITHVWLAVLLGPAAAAVRADQPVTWQLLPQAQVDSSGILLSQVLITTPTVVLPQIRLAPAPPLGQTASLSREQIVELVRKSAASELLTTNWSGATQIRVSRRTRQFTASDLVQLLTATLQRDYVQDRGDLELRLAQSWTPIRVPDEPLTLTVPELPAAGISSAFVVRFELGDAAEQVGSWQQPVQARIWRQVPIAHSLLFRGQSLSDADVTLERRDILVLREALLTYPDPSGTLELKENLSPGQPLLNRSVRIRPAILRGEMVEGVYQDGALSISLKVESLEDGLPGQTIRVLNPRTQRELFGKVQNEQTILITL